MIKKDLYDLIHENTELFYKETDGGAQYLCTKPINNTIVGDLSTAVIRLDGNPVLTIKTSK
jgi:hypothetical protein